MKGINKYKYYILCIMICAYFAIQQSMAYLSKVQNQKQKELFIIKINNKIKQVFLKQNQVKDTIFVLDKKKYKISYSINHQLQKFIKRRIKRYRPDYSAVVVIENKTGKIISAIDYARYNNKFSKNLVFSNTHPSASLFKIITSADLLESARINIKDRFFYQGKGTTLYKWQLKNKKTKWSRYQSLQSAFAISNNVVFGKAAIQNLNSNSIFTMASRFGFNNNLMTDVSLPKSKFPMAINQYNLAELATGFNKQTTIAPVHAAVLSSVIANDGYLISPQIINSVTRFDNKKSVINYEQTKRRVISKQTTNSLQKMMHMTIERGTARNSFNKLRNSLRKNLYIGGKTGSITGGIPYGKRDWFTAFAKPYQDSGISIAVMNINKEKWYIRSSELAQQIIEFYFTKINKLNSNINAMGHLTKNKVDTKTRL